MTSKNITTIKVWDTTYNADSVEWCPVAPYHNIFVCGTYQLVEEVGTDTEKKSRNQNEQRKIGFLYLLSIESQLSFRKIQTLELAGILDAKWCHKRVNDKIILGVATAKGELIVYELKQNKTFPDNIEMNMSLQLLTKINIDQEGKTLALSLDWCFQKEEECISCNILITVSDSLGKVHLFRLEDSTLKSEAEWKLHEYEAWITAFDYWTPSIIYSGGDDMKFFMLDSRAGCENPVFVNKSHEMGVTSFHSNKAREYCLISGSYDEKLRFWDTRNLRKPQYQLPLIGGIWRLKWDPNNTGYIIAACMYGGFCIVNAENIMNPKIVAVYKEHKDIAYGSDWSYHSQCDLKREFATSDFNEFSTDSRDALLFASCSFYDHKLCVSVFDKNSEHN